ncbi:MAG: RDD family protein [Gammaproteobacteria bacterium]
MSDNLYQPPTAELTQPGAPQGELASRWMRVWGVLLDTVIQLTVMAPFLWLSGYWQRAMAGTVAPAETLIAGVGGFVLYLVINGYTLHKRGQSLGKIAVGTQIVSAHSRELKSLVHIAGLRLLPVSVVSNIPVIGAILALVDVLFVFRADKRCVHDLIAGTRVIKYGG